MTIRIIPEPEIELTQSEYERLQREWEAAQQGTTAPVTFEAFVRSRRRRTTPNPVLVRVQSVAKEKPAYDWVDYALSIPLIDKFLGRSK